MTSKAVISQLEVNERRLKGVYDQLESGSLKKAIAEADKVLKKNPNLLPAKVLKGLALHRSGKSQEAFNLVNEVVALSPADESTLNTLSYFMRETNQKNRIVDIYEEAFKQFPNREDICTNLFCCHVKSFNYLSQQKVAIQLKKLNSSHIEYAMWPMIGNVLHGVYNNDLRLVKLGEAMLTKYFNSSPILSAERIEFLIFIFQKLNKIEECFQWLNGPTLKDVVDNNQNKILFTGYKIDILLKLERREEASVLQMELITLNSDDVCLWRDYINNAVKMNLDKERPNSLAFIVDKLNEYDSNRIAIKVAKIHLSIALEKVDLDLYNNFGSKVDKILEYFIRFGDRSSCFYDIYTFLCLDCFTRNDKMEILRLVNEHCNSMTITSNKEVEKYYLMMALKRTVEGSTDIDIPKLIDVYNKSLPFSVNFGVTEIKPCDNLVKLAVSCYHDKLLSNVSDTQSLVEAMILLKQSIETSPANYNLRLQLSHLYGVLCCQDQSIGQFNDLEIKQLMWDSLGHHYIIPALYVPSYVERVNFLTKNLSRKQKNKLEIEENLVTCYKLGNYGKIPEIIDFHHAIDASVMSCMSETEIIYINTVLKSNSCDDLFESCGRINLKTIESVEPEMDVMSNLSYLKDFRDLKTSPNFAPIERFWTIDDQNSSFKHIVLWIAQRYMVLRAYYSSAKVTMETVVKLDILSHGTSVIFNEESSNYYKILIETRRHVLKLWSDAALLCGSYSCLHNDLTGCVEPPFALFASSFYPDLIVSSIDTIISFHDVFVKKISSDLPDWNSTMLVPIKNVVQTLLIMKVNNENIFTVVPHIIGKLTVLCEMIAVITLNLCMVENMTKPIKPKLQVKRKNKRKMDSVVDNAGDIKYKQYEYFLESTNFHTIPKQLLLIIVDMDQFVTAIKASIDLVTKNEEPTMTIMIIYDSWKKTLDDTMHFMNCKQTQLDLIDKLVDNDFLNECLNKVNNLSIEANDV